jgi:hypothetical protein
MRIWRAIVETFGSKEQRETRTWSVTVINGSYPAIFSSERNRENGRSFEASPVVRIANKTNVLIEIMFEFLAQVSAELAFKPVFVKKI